MSQHKIHNGEKRWYKAYNAKGELRLHVWAMAHVGILAEEGAFQARLNKFELGYVDVSSSDSRTPNFRMVPQGKLD